jgi:hypothetical protein
VGDDGHPCRRSRGRKGGCSLTLRLINAEWRKNGAVQASDFTRALAAISCQLSAISGYRLKAT